MSVVVRRPTRADADDLARINVETWRDAYAGLVPQTRLDEMTLLTYRQRWLDRLSQNPPEVATFVADVDGVLASYAIGGPYRPQEGGEPEETASLGELYALYTHPRLQRRGAGAAAHHGLLGWLGAAGHVEAVLWVLEGNGSSRSWYANRGWQADGATSQWTAHGHPLPEIRLRRALPCP